MSYIENPTRILIAGKEPGYCHELKRHLLSLGIHTLTIPRQTLLGQQLHIDRLVGFAQRSGVNAVITGKRNENLEYGYDESGFILAQELQKAGIPVLMLSTESHRQRATECGYAFVRTGSDLVVITKTLLRLLGGKVEEDESEVV
jgi:hypothetical protein